MKSDLTIFMTGATGLIGAHLLRLLIDLTSANIILLIRPTKGFSAANRGMKLIRDVAPDNYKLISNRVKIVEGDQAKYRFGLAESQYNELINVVTEIYHSAALAEFRQPIARVRNVNVGGAKNVFDFALQCQNLRKVNYVSTAFIAGDLVGDFSESDFDLNQGFNNTYELSKFEAESLVRGYSALGLKINVYRPSIVVGDYETGVTNNFRMFYQPFRSLSRCLFNAIPICRSTVLNIVPCDYVAKAIFLLSMNYHDGDVFNIVSPENVPIMHLMEFACNYLGYPETLYQNLEEFDFGALTVSQQLILAPYIPYFNFKARFVSYKTQEKLMRLSFSYPDVGDDFLARLFDYGVKQRYLFSNAK